MKKNKQIHKPEKEIADIKKEAIEIVDALIKKTTLALGMIGVALVKEEYNEAMGMVGELGLKLIEIYDEIHKGK